jgi:POT family proton-dependent oligopeptide transporter
MSDTDSTLRDASTPGTPPVTPGAEFPEISRRQPPGLWSLFIVEMWERFSYYGMRAILVLYLVAEVGPDIANPGRNWSDANAAHLYGYYTGLVYLTPILGGLIADRLIGTHRSMVAGSLLITLGHVVLAVSGLGIWEFNAVGMSIFIVGLALIILGTGHFKPCVSVMVGQLYKEHDPRRDGGFTIFYMGINVGAFLAPLVCGWLGEKVGWHYGFGAAAVGMLLGLITYFIARPIYLQGVGDPPEGKANTTPLFIIGAMALSAVVGLAYHFGVFTEFGNMLGGVTEKVHPNILTFGGVGLILLVAGWFIGSQKKGERGQVFTILCFIIFNAFFWMAFEQAGSSLTLFADRNTDRVILGWEMPASWFQVINPFLIVTLAPLYSILWGKLGRMNLNPTQSLKIFYGLVLLGVGYIFMVFAGVGAADGTLVGPHWLALAYLLHTMGELCLSPTGLSFVTKASPVRLISFIMGLWFLSSVVANFGGGLVAATVTLIEKGQVEMVTNDGGTFTVRDRVGGDQSFKIAAPEGGSDDTARSLGIYTPGGKKTDEIEGQSIALTGYVAPTKTLGDVIARINDKAQGKVTMSITDDGKMIQLKDLTSGPDTFEVTSTPTSHTAKDLMIMGRKATITADTITSGDLMTQANDRAIRFAVKLADLRDGRGIDIIEGQPDFIIRTRDGETFEIDLGASQDGDVVIETATTVGDVVQRIMEAVSVDGEEAIEVQATLNKEGQFEFLDVSSGDASFSIADAPGALAASQLGMAVAADNRRIKGAVLVDPAQLKRLSSTVNLAWLNHRKGGIHFRHEITDFTIHTRDGGAIEINLGAINAINEDTPLADLNGGAGVVVDEDAGTPDILFVGRDGTQYAVNLSGIETVGEMTHQISENTGKINPFWNKWGIKYAGQGDFFFLFVFSSAAAALVVLILTPVFKRMLHGVE